MQLRLIGYCLGIALLIAPIAATANQSDKYGRVNEVPRSVHEVPAFVCDRVELVAGLAVHGPQRRVGPSGRESLARSGDPVRGGRDAICTCHATLMEPPVGTVS